MASQYHHAAFMNIQRGGAAVASGPFLPSGIYGSTAEWMDGWITNGGRRSLAESKLCSRGRERCAPHLIPGPPSAPSPSITVA